MTVSGMGGGGVVVAEISQMLQILVVDLLGGGVRGAEGTGEEGRVRASEAGAAESNRG